MPIFYYEKTKLKYENLYKANKNVIEIESIEENYKNL